jgi:iron-sulfur cluster repair protein YtfE (RIC family)
MMAKPNRAPRPAARDAADPMRILKDDHERVDSLFKRFEKLRSETDNPEKEMIVRQACAELKIHATLEEEIFYPAAREILVEEYADIMDEAEVEHASIKDLVEQLESIGDDGPLFDAKFIVLAEYVRHHVKEEEGEMFPKLKKAKLLDAEALAEEMKTRREELGRELGLIEENDDENFEREVERA